MQEAYRPLCSKYSLCCPNWVAPRPGYPPGRVPLGRVPPQAGYPPRQGTPGQGTPLGRVPPGRVPPPVYPPPGYPLWPGYPPGRVPPWAGYPPARVPPWPGYPPGWTWQGTPQLPHGILGNVAKHYGIWVPPCGPWAGYPPARVPPPAGHGRVPPLAAPWHSGKCCKALWDMGTLPCGQTDGRTDACQNITFLSYYVRGR